MHILVEESEKQEKENLDVCNQTMLLPLLVKRVILEMNDSALH